MVRVLFVLGTRPEAIKLAPIILHQKARPEQFHVSVCATGQHRDLLDTALNIFGIVPDFDLNVMSPGQTLGATSARILSGLERVLTSVRPDAVIVQGDTTTTLCGALGAFYQRIPVAHVEAGLRTGDMQQPLPEEMNRVLTTRLATLHFAPTSSAKENLLREGCSASAISVTGNSGIDAMLYVHERLHRGELTGIAGLDLDSSKKLLLVTSHRRENFGSKFESICRAVRELAKRSDVQVVFPAHPNPQVRECARSMLGNCANVRLLDSLPYVQFVDVMRRAYLIVTDSGGIQEEAPCLGKPTLVLRDKTERFEGVVAGGVRLVGTCEERIVAEAAELLDSPRAYRAMARAHSLYGDGRASARISDGLIMYFEQQRLERTTTALQKLGQALEGWGRRFAPARAS
jgi:UDP-N-acetylglucosamine 2-epimerase (non-hydrolysing)